MIVLVECKDDCNKCKQLNTKVTKKGNVYECEEFWSTVSEERLQGTKVFMQFV